jgi:hypothetical protein
MRRKVLTAALAAACAGCVALPGAASAGTLDQQQPNGGVGYQVHSMQSLAQIFTAGLSGGLDQVDLKLSAGGSPPILPLVVEIRNAPGGAPDGTVLASGSVPASAAPATSAFVSLGFATSAAVTAGTQYAIVAYNADTGGRFWGWAFDATNPYTTGSAEFQLASPPGPGWNNTGDSDLAFKTYVATPTPTATATGQRAAALKKCKKKRSKAKRRKCRKKARNLPV